MTLPCTLKITMPEITRHTLDYGNTRISFDLSRLPRKAMAIHVHPDSSVSVDAPQDASPEEILLHVRKRAAWILRQQRAFQRYSLDFPPRLYVSGETHRFLGRQYRLKVIGNPEERESVALDREFLTVLTHHKEQPARVRKQVETWYRRQALEVFAERVEHWYPHFERLGAVRPAIAARQMRTRWGSCTARGRITFNTKLVMAPRMLIDYVVVHELCHLQEHNHGAQFQHLLTRIMPDWKELKEKLDHYEFG